MLSNVIYHFINPGESTIGRKDRDGNHQPDICLSGLRFVSFVWCKDVSVVCFCFSTVFIESVK